MPGGVRGSLDRAGRRCQSAGATANHLRWHAPRLPGKETVVPRLRGDDRARDRRSRLRGHFRMTFSAGVSASMNAGRLKIRSAYFISGAADFGSDTP